MSKKINTINEEEDKYLVEIQKKRESELRPTFQQRMTYYILALFTSIVPICKK